jgi:uncharacterized oxidoreductase
MLYQNKTILITGGATGIGFALAKRFVAADNTVIICGRRAEKLAEARQLVPELHTVLCDVAIESDRIALHEQVVSQFPQLDVLINNAGIQNRPPPLTNTQDWAAHRREIATNL